MKYSFLPCFVVALSLTSSVRSEELITYHEEMHVVDSISMDPMLDLWLKATSVPDDRGNVGLSGRFHHGLEAGSMSSLYRYDGQVLGRMNIDGSVRLVLVRTHAVNLTIGGPFVVQIITGKIVKKSEGLLSEEDRKAASALMQAKDKEKKFQLVLEKSGLDASASKIFEAMLNAAVE